MAGPGFGMIDGTRMFKLPPPVGIPGVSRIIAIGSGKGGVGKTTVAVNLSLALGGNGTAVGLFDADPYGPNVPLMLGVSRKQPSGGYVPVARAQGIPYIEPLDRFGLKVMSIGFVVGDADTLLPDPRFSGHIIRQTMQDVLWGELDLLLLDLPPGTGEPQQTLLKTIQLDGVVLVTTPQDLSLMDTSRSLGMFRQAGVPILGVVENMSYLSCPHCGEEIQLFHRSERRWAVEESELELLGRIPMSLAISRPISVGHPLLQPDGDADGAAPFREIASRLYPKLGLEE